MAAPLLDRVAARRAATRPAGRSRRSRQPAKGFSMPAFWSLDGARVALASAGISPDREDIGIDFESQVQSVLKSDGPAFACILARMRVFSQARFQFRTVGSPQVADLFGDRSLSLLETPWANGTTGQLLGQMELDDSLAGNYYATVVDKAGRYGRRATGPGRQITRLRPDWTTIIIRSPSEDPWAPDAYVAGYMFTSPGGRGAAGDPLILAADEVCHYAPLPDPAARFRGMSWLTPVLREIRSDQAASDHKLAFFKGGATPNLAVNLPADIDPDEFDAYVTKFREEHEGHRKAYRTLFLAGADVTPLTVDLRALDFKAVQGAGETRIAAAAGVHPAIVGLSEGLQGSSLNAGNFGAARRLFVDMTLRTLWANAAKALETLVPPPRPMSELWTDDRYVPFLREDLKDEAEILAVEVAAIRQLLDGGYEPDAAVRAIMNRDLGQLLSNHSGLYSVQLQPASTGTPPNGTPPGTSLEGLAGMLNGTNGSGGNGRQGAAAG